MRTKVRRTGRLLSLVLALALVLGLLPVTVLAAGSIEVSITIFDQGVFAVDKDGSPMMQKTITVTDQDNDGYYSLDEALYAAHEAYAAGGTSAYQAGSGDYGYFVSKLWNQETSATGFYRNNGLTGAVNEEHLDAGDCITAFIYKDQESWSDRYSYFTEQSKVVCVNEEFELTLKYDQWGTVNPQPTAPIGVYDETGAYSVPDAFRGEHLYGEHYTQTVATETNGTVKFSITEPGTYLVTAQYDSANYTDYSGTPTQYYLVPPLCTVTVLSEEDYKNYRQIEKAKELLTWENLSSEPANAVTAAPVLPSELSVEGETVSVSWSCDDTTYVLSVSSYGGSWSAYVDRPAAEDVTCTLTATLSYCGATDVKSFPVTVKAEGVIADKTDVVRYADLISGIAGAYSATTDAWTVMDMKAYNGTNVKGETYAASAAAVALADAAIGASVDTSPLQAVSVDGTYGIYSVPYVSLAYQAAGSAAGGEGDHTLESLKSAMVNYLNELSAYSDVESVTPVLAGLAPYYNKGDAEVDTAVDQAVNWLSGQQNSDGTFSSYGTSNANTTAMAIVGLAAVGVDAHTDPLFIKNYKSAVEGLLSFALADCSGFGYKGNVTKNALATEQGFRALVAYARFKAAGEAYNIYLEAKNATAAAAAPAISATPVPGGSAGNGGSDNVSVTVQVMVPPTEGGDGAYTYSDNAAAYTNLITTGGVATVNAGDSAYDVLVKVLDHNGLTYSVSGSGYFSMIDGLKQFDRGSNSGWMYRIDGIIPNVTCTEYYFTRSATMTWFYTCDYTKESSWTSGGSGGSTSAAPAVEPKGDGTYAVTLPATGAAVAAIPNAEEGQVAVILRPDGSREIVKKSLVENGIAYVLLQEDCTVALVDNSRIFADVAPGDWYAGAVDFAASHGLFTGTGADMFEPESPMSRAMLVTVLYQLEDAPEGGTASFSDVSPDSWYAPAVAWAADRALVAGIGAGFSPDDDVKREQIAVILYQYACMAGLDTTRRGDLSAYQDAGEISGWAEEAMAWAVGTGLMAGHGDGTLDPGGSALRAEVAVMLRQLVGLLVK